MGSSQKRAIQKYRSRLSQRGLARFEVLGRDTDRELIRSLARLLAEDGPDASRLREAVNQTIAGEPPKRGGILAALGRSPLGDADLDLPRSHEKGREVAKPRRRIDNAMLEALTSNMPPQAQDATELVRAMRDGDRY